MIGFLKGEIILKSNNSLVVNINNVGYKVFVNKYVLEKSKLEQEISLFVYTHVREQEISLYGFLTEEEEIMFKLLISVSGIGPKVALNLLSVADVKSIKTAILRKDISILTQVSGVGKKTAEKLVLELSGKVNELGFESSQISDINVIEALKSMGYSLSESRDALNEVPKNITDTSEKIRLALKFLGRSIHSKK